MSNEEKATIILEELNEVTNINWNMKEFYIRAIIKGIKKIKVQEED